MKKILALLFLLTVLLSNFISMPGIGERYEFKTIDSAFEFHAIPTKGRDEAMMLRRFERFTNSNPSYKDKKIYRTFKRQWWKFWESREYLFDWKYKYPYMEYEGLQNEGF